MPTGSYTHPYLLSDAHIQISEAVARQRSRNDRKAETQQAPRLSDKSDLGREKSRTTSVEHGRSQGKQLSDGNPLLSHSLTMVITPAITPSTAAVGSSMSGVQADASNTPCLDKAALTCDPAGKRFWRFWVTLQVQSVSFTSKLREGGFSVKQNVVMSTNNLRGLLFWPL